MSRIRTIKPEFFYDEDVAYLPPYERLLFIGLWTLADRMGRLEDRPVRIKAQLLPYDDANVDTMLTALAELRFLVRYEVDGRRFIQIRSFSKHQRPNTREPESSIPPPPKTEQNPTSTRTHVHAREKHEQAHARTLGMDLGNGSGEGKGKEIAPRREDASAVPTALVPVEPAILVFECDGEPGEWPLTKSILDRLQELFPSLDAMDECRRALAWVEASPGRRKTARGMRKFLTGWLGNSQDRGGPRNKGAPPGQHPLRPLSASVAREQANLEAGMRFLERVKDGSGH